MMRHCDVCMCFQDSTHKIDAAGNYNCHLLDPTEIEDSYTYLVSAMTRFVSNLLCIDSSVDTAYRKLV